MDQWFYIHLGRTCGPVSGEELGNLAANGGLTPSDPIWRRDFPPEEVVSACSVLVFFPGGRGRPALQGIPAAARLPALGPGAGVAARFHRRRKMTEIASSQAPSLCARLAPGRCRRRAGLPPGPGDAAGVRGGGRSAAGPPQRLQAGDDDGDVVALSAAQVLRPDPAPARRLQLVTPWSTAAMQSSSSMSAYNVGRSEQHRVARLQVGLMHIDVHAGPPPPRMLNTMCRHWCTRTSSSALMVLRRASLRPPAIGGQLPQPTCEQYNGCPRRDHEEQLAAGSRAIGSCPCPRTRWAGLFKQAGAGLAQRRLEVLEDGLLVGGLEVGRAV